LSHANVDPPVDRLQRRGRGVGLRVGSPPTVRANPIATTALVLKVVDGDTIDIRDDDLAAAIRVAAGQESVADLN
jgi:hypothetical protein